MNDSTRQEPTLVLGGTGKTGRRVVRQPRILGWSARERRRTVAAR